MKNKLFTVSFIIALSMLLTCALASAQGPAVKIGIIDVREIIQSSEAGRQASAELKKTVDKKKVAIQQAEDNLKKMKDALDKQRSVLKEDTIKERELEIQKNYRDYQRLVNDAKEELSAREQQLGQKMFPEVIKIIKAFGEREGYTLILDASTVPYYSKGNDVTKRIIAEMNKGAATAQPPKNTKK